MACGGKSKVIFRDILLMELTFKNRRRIKIGLVSIVTLFGVAWGIATLSIGVAARGRLYDKASIQQLEKCRAAVVLGCNPKSRRGLSNLFFTRRIEAARELYEAGRVDVLIVSGDNHIADYDEPSSMKAALVAAGVPENKIVCDYAGFRTLDSVVRAKKVFGLDAFTIVSQPDHLRRAIFLARAFGCDAKGYAAMDVNGRYSIRTTIREQFAKIVAFGDAVFRRSPKFLGSKEQLPL